MDFAATGVSEFSHFQQDMPDRGRLDHHLPEKQVRSPTWSMAITWTSGWNRVHVRQPISPSWTEHDLSWYGAWTIFSFHARAAVAIVAFTVYRQAEEIPIHSIVTKDLTLHWQFHWHHFCSYVPSSQVIKFPLFTHHHFRFWVITHSTTRFIVIG